jgi:hypothetical protein
MKPYSLLSVFSSLPSLVLATETFSASAGDPEVGFSGSVEVLENGVVLLRYNLSLTHVMAPGNGVQYRSGSVQASVRLRPSESVQIFKSGTRSYDLTLEPLAHSGAKGN